jgi:hypothetical protein
MTPEDRVRAGGVVLVFDAANVPAAKLFRLAKDAKRRVENLRVVVPIVAHIEELAHIRRRLKGAKYDASIWRKNLELAEVEVWPLDVEAAEAIAERLCAWSPTSGAWQDARWRRLHGDQSPRSANKHPPATVDWFTAASCSPEGIVVTVDTRGEFSSCDTIHPDALARVLVAMAAG